MIPLLNIGLRVARSGSEQVMRSLERLDMIHDEGKDLQVALLKICQATEKTLAYEIHKVHPEQEVIGYHCGAIDSPTKSSNKYWRVNPIDGLQQYVHGLPVFCLTMACYEDDKLIHAIIIDSSSGDEYCASKGRGAQLNGRRIRTSKRKNLESSQIHGGHEQSRETLEAFDHYQKVCRVLYQQDAQNYGQLSNCLALAYVAAGKLDAAWHTSLDASVDAGLLLAQEAGALVSDFNGGKALTKGELVCANPKLLKQLLIALKSC